jgi:hypothetical protein
MMHYKYVEMKLNVTGGHGNRQRWRQATQVRRSSPLSFIPSSSHFFLDLMIQKHLDFPILALEDI